jgi:hydrogenase expression/formation protein HypC
MCLAIPAQITELKEDNKAIVNVGGVFKEISLALLQDTVNIGDFVIMHVGFALSKLNQEVARQTLADYKEMLDMEK